MLGNAKSQEGLTKIYFAKTTIVEIKTIFTPARALFFSRIFTHFHHLNKRIIMDYLPLIIQLISGAAGGNIIASIVKSLDMGTVLNSILGVVGGGLGGQLLGMVGLDSAAAAAGSSSMDIGSILGSVAGGGVGGGALLGVVSLIKGAMGKS
jgi:uncharacterized membrane protein YeaQ/YmgE (transglycosylase-associated protein family)